ncbi:MAG: rRNA maturation RNase YbeY [Rhizobiaceae bacterium]
MITVDCAIESGEWPNVVACQMIADEAILATAQAVDNRVPDEAEVSLLFTDDSQMQALNAQWRDQNTSTNVLSFAASKGCGQTTPMLGDIVLALETITREAAEQDKAFDDHLSHLIVHGFLHLLGFDHIEDAEAGVMEQLEREICASLGIADPYAEH